jgi:hypothetical protein
MSETQWPHTLHISMNQEKQKKIRFPKTEGLVLSIIAIIQISDVLIPKPDVLIFTG